VLPRLCAQLAVLCLEVEDHADAGEVQAGVEELTDPDQALDVLLAVATGAALGALGRDQAATLVDAEVLDRRTGELGGHRDRVQRVVTVASHGLLLGVHKASFILWFGAMSVHVLWHVWKLPRLALDRLPGRGLRLATVGAALGVGVVLAVATVPLADHWQDRATGAVGIDAF